MAYINDKKVLSVFKTEFVPAVYQEKTITPQNFTPEVVADYGYAALSKVKLDGILVDPHNPYTSQTDSTIAYQKSVPSGALKYATLDKLGFMSYKCNQLFDNANTELIGKTFSGANQTTYSYSGFAMKVFNLVIGKTYTITSTKDMRLGFTDDITNSGTYQQTNNYTFTASTTYLLITNRIANEYTEMFENLMLNSGSTALPYQPYFTGIRDSAITSVKSYDSNNNLIDTFTIPDEIQALEGYGRGINENCYNVLDLNTKSYTQKVASYTFTGNETLTEYTRSSDSKKTYAVAINGRATTTNVLFESLSLSTATTMNTMEDNSYRGATDTTSVIFYSTSYQTSASMLAFLTGKTIYFELATSQETDISSYITDNTIQVEAGGYLVFENQYGQSVPSEVTYLVEVE